MEMRKLGVLWRARLAIAQNFLPICKLLIAKSTNATSAKTIEFKCFGEPLFLRPDLVDLKVFLSCMSGEFDVITMNPDDVETVVDLGGFIGISARVFADKYPKAKIFVVEPDPDNFDLLKQNVDAFPQIQPINGAICGKPQKLTFFKRSSGNWGTSIKSSEDAIASNSFEVQGYDMRQLSDIMGFDRIDLLKVDIEGAEADVFAQPSDILNETKVVLIELHDYLDPQASKVFSDFARDRTNVASGGEKILSTING